MKRTRVLTLLAVLAAGPTPSAVAQSPASDSPSHARAGAAAAAVAADVGSATVAVADVRDTIAARRRDDLARNRLDSFTSAAVEQAVNDLVDVRLFAQAARSAGVDREPDVARRLQLIVDEELARIEMARAAALDDIDDKALREYYGAHPDQFRSAPRVHARHIVVRTREEAEAARKRVSGGDEFADVAREINIDSTRASGGDLGWVARGAMVRPFDAALFALKRGDISEPVQTAMGFHVVRVDDAEPGALAPFDQARDDVRRKVIEARVAAARNRLMERYPVVLHPNAIDELKK